MLLIYTVLLLVLSKDALGSTVMRLRSRNVGEFSSPNYPENYPNQLDLRYYIKAPSKRHIIIIEFLDFRTEEPKNEKKTDYLEFIDGKRNEVSKAQYFYGTMEAPFTITTTKNRAWLRMVTNEERSYSGFRAIYSFFDTSSYCKVENLRSQEDITAVTSCSDELYGYASQCKVEKGDYQFNATCIEKQFTIINESKTLIARIVEKCEDTYLEDCPYDEIEVFEFYESNQLPSVEITLTPEQQAEIDVLGQESQVNVGKGGRCSALTCLQFNDGTYVFPRRCGSLRRVRKRRRCLQCRVLYCRFVPQFFGFGG